MTISTEFSQELDDQIGKYSKQVEYNKIALEGASGINTSIIALPPIALEQFEKKVKPVKKKQSLYNEVIVPLDKKAVSIAASINELKSQVVAIGIAQTVGVCNCVGKGTTLTMYNTLLQARGYNFSGNLFPYVTQTLSDSNAGFGTMNLISTGSLVGSYYTTFGPTGISSLNPDCVVSCNTIESQVSNLLSKINTLTTELTTINSDIRTVKEMRISVDLQEFSINKHQTETNNKLTAVTNLKTLIPKYEEQGIL